MKKYLKLLILMIVVVGFNMILGCGNIGDKTITKKKDVREIVWAQLSKEEHNEIIGDWKDGKIEKILAKKDSMKFLLQDEKFDGKEVYLITFKSKNQTIIGNVQRLVDVENNKIIGYSYRN